MSFATALSSHQRYLVKPRTVSAMKKHLDILLIDDDEVFIFLTSKMLQNSGKVNSIHIAASAVEAISYLRSAISAPDIILLDLNMPGMDGWEFLDHYQLVLSNMQTEPQLYVVSSSIAGEDAERAINIKGVTGYLSKPMTNESVQAILDSN